MKLDSLKNTAEFDFIYKNSFKSFHRNFVIHIYEIRAGHRHPLVAILKDRATLTQKNILLGLSVSKKIGKATKRNLIKRRVRAILRELDISHKIIVFIAKPGILELDYATLSKDISYHINRQAIYSKNTHHKNEKHENNER